jgi:hypothetical protein
MDKAQQAHWRKFGRHLQSLIREAGMSNTDFAQHAEMTLTQVSRILNAGSGTRRSTLPRFIRALRMGGLVWSTRMANELYEGAGFVPPPADDIVAEVFGPEYAPERLSDDRESGNLPRIVAMYDGLTEEGKDDLFAFAQFLYQRKRRDADVDGRQRDE